MDSDSSGHNAQTEEDKNYHSKFSRHYDRVINKWKVLSKPNKTILKLLPIFLVLAAIPITVKLSQMQQNYQQEAAQRCRGNNKFCITPTPTPIPPTPTPIPATPTPTTGPTPTPGTIPIQDSANVWINQDELLALPMSGSAWDTVKSTSNCSTGANISDQNSNHDISTMGCALYAARTGDATARTKAITAIESAIGTEAGARWLAVGRNLGGYIIAADVLGIKSGPIYDWLSSFMTKKLAHDNNGTPITLKESAWASGSNASAQEGFVHAALASYLQNKSELDWNWAAFRRYTGDRTSPWKITSNDDSWQIIPSDPVGIQNSGAVKNSILIDGAISNDMSRGGSLAWPPAYTSYPWVGLEGAVPAALVLSRQGYPAWTVSNSALRRAATFLYNVKIASNDVNWYDTTRAPEIKHVLNKIYGLNYPEGPTKTNARTVSFTDWTLR